MNSPATAITSGKQDNLSMLLNIITNTNCSTYQQATKLIFCCKRIFLDLLKIFNGDQTF